MRKSDNLSFRKIQHFRFTIIKNNIFSIPLIYFTSKLSGQWAAMMIHQHRILIRIISGSLDYLLHLLGQVFQQDVIQANFIMVSHLHVTLFSFAWLFELFNLLIDGIQCLCIFLANLSIFQ